MVLSVTKQKDNLYWDRKNGQSGLLEFHSVDLSS